MRSTGTETLVIVLIESNASESMFPVTQIAQTFPTGLEFIKDELVHFSLTVIPYKSDIL